MAVVHNRGIGAVVVSGAMALVTMPSVMAQPVESQRVGPSIQAVALESRPLMDGIVNSDPTWRNAIPATGFTQVRPNAGQPATQRTEVYVGYTDTALYIGVMAYDDSPEGILVTDSRRDSSLNDTDSFQVIIDGLRDRQNGFIFGTNPAGVEYDAQVINEAASGGFGGGGGGGGGFNLNWDTTWEVRTAVGEFGWSAEMEIPFRSLRYGNEDVQTWGINFQRNIRRNNEVAYWAPLDIQYNLNRVSEAGTVQGVAVPRRRNLLVTPYALVKSERGGRNAAGTRQEEEFGFDLKYSVTSSLTLDATYNTDFAQVEVDDLQVNLDRFSLFFPEKRPFFLENAGQFAVGNPREAELFFSRRIGVGPGGAQIPIDGGARLSGRVGGNTNVGLLRMRTESLEGVASANDFSVARISQDLPNRSSVGFMFVERDGDGPARVVGEDDYNRTYGIDGRWGIGDETQITGWAAQTDTPGLSGDDQAFGMTATYSDINWDFSGGYAEVQKNFNPEVGFLSRRDYTKLNGRWMRRIRPNDLWGLHEIRPHMSYQEYKDPSGFVESSQMHTDSHWEFQNGYEIHTGWNRTREGVKTPFSIVSGVVVPAGEYEHDEAQLVFQTDQSAPLSLNLQSRIGGFFGGDRVNLDPTVRFRVGEKFNSQLSWTYNDVSLPVPNGDFKVNLARLRLTYSFTPRMSLQTLVQYNERDDVIATNIRFSWLQSANSGLYLVYNEVDESGFGAPQERAREFIIKYSYIFDVFN
ncbi:MAG: hypothetical protein RLZZ385_2082 [Pseudomonadota bacterium]